MDSTVTGTRAGTFPVYNTVSHSFLCKLETLPSVYSNERYHESSSKMKFTPNNSTPLESTVSISMIAVSPIFTLSLLFDRQLKHPPRGSLSKRRRTCIWWRRTGRIHAFRRAVAGATQTRALPPSPPPRINKLCRVSAYPVGMTPYEENQYPIHIRIPRVGPLPLAALSLFYLDRI